MSATPQPGSVSCVLSCSLNSLTLSLTLCQSLYAETLQATASEGLAQGPYVAASAGFEPVSLRSKGIDSTNVPPRPTLAFNSVQCAFADALVSIC